MAGAPPLPPARRTTGEYGFVAHEEQPAVPSEQPAPHSVSPVVHVELKEDGFEARVRGNLLRRLAPWIAPAIMSVLGWLGGLVVGYYDGLKKAAGEVAAVKLEIDVLTARLEFTDKRWNHEGVVSDDHEARILRLERTLKLDPSAAAVLSSPTLIVKTPVVP